MRTGVFLPAVVTVAVVAEVFRILYHPTATGPLNTLLGWFGLGPYGFISDQGMALYSVIGTVDEYASGVGIVRVQGRRELTARLTGTVSGGRNETPIADGKISSDEISFTVTMERQGNTIKMTYKGKVIGNEIKLTRTREGADRVQEITAIRATT